MLETVLTMIIAVIVMGNVAMGAVWVWLNLWPKHLKSSTQSHDGPAKPIDCIVCGEAAEKGDYFCTRHSNYGGEG